MILFVLFGLVWSDCSLREAPNVTESGYSCQKWNAFYPHVPKVTPVFDNHNRFFVFSPELGKKFDVRCASPDGDAVPWCYTTNPNKRWEHCVVEGF